MGRAFVHFNLALAPAAVGLSIGYYLLQGVRWHFLLRSGGIILPLRRTMLLNLAGQSTGLLPAGELTRAVLVAEEAGVHPGAAVGTVTVQELLYTLVLIAFAVPAAVTQHAVAAIIWVALGGVLAVIALLTTPVLWRRMSWLVRHTPLLDRLADEIESLQVEVATLMRQRDTLLWSALTVLGAIDAITLFWVIVQGVAPGAISWTDAALIYAVSHLAGALSAIPGGIGAYEASVVGLLVNAGVGASVATAAALLHRAADKGLNTILGVATLAAARRSRPVVSGRPPTDGADPVRSEAPVGESGARAVG
jgi:glycosyltransferase 2 family protein